MRKMEDIEEEMYKRKEQKELIRSVMDQCNKWVGDGSNISIHVTIEHHYHGTIDQLTINGDG